MTTNTTKTMTTAKWAEMMDAALQRLTAAAAAVELTAQQHAERYPGDREAQRDAAELTAALAQAKAALAR